MVVAALSLLLSKSTLTPYCRGSCLRHVRFLLRFCIQVAGTSLYGKHDEEGAHDNSGTFVFSFRHSTEAYLKVKALAIMT